MGMVGVFLLNVRVFVLYDVVIIMKFDCGMKFMVFNEKNGWVYIEVNGLKGWVVSYYFLISFDLVESLVNVGSLFFVKKVYIVYGGMNVRSDVFILVLIVECVVKGDLFIIIGLKGSWYEIKFDNGQIGYVVNWVV